MAALPGKLHNTKHGNVQRPKVADSYLKSAKSIDKHNHADIDSLGLEDPWQTKCNNYRDHRIYLHKFLTSWISILHKGNGHGALPV